MITISIVIARRFHFAGEKARLREKIDGECQNVSSGPTRRRSVFADTRRFRASTHSGPFNQAAYPQPRSQRPGVGFPLLRWVALVGLATAAVIDSAFGPYRGKETGESALFRSMFDSLRHGDVIVADRYYCSYWLVALLLALGVDVVFRKHQLRHTDFRRGRRLGRNDHIITWEKPQRPQWMDQATYDSLPATLRLREVRGQVTTPGSRVKDLVIVTTLLDYETVPTADLLELYHQRWHVEIDLRSIKTQMKMDILRCKSPEMVRKEIWAHLLAIIWSAR